MRIENASSTIRPTSDNPLPGSTPVRDGEPPVSMPAKPMEGFSPTSDLARLLEKLKALPEVRPDVMFDVKFRILSGELDGPDANQDTAQQIDTARTDNPGTL